MRSALASLSANLRLLGKGPNERRADVVVLCLDAVEPAHGVATRLNLFLGRLGELGQPFSVTQPNAVAVDFREPVEGVAADRLQHREPRLAGGVLSFEEAVVHQRGEDAEIRVADRLRGLERAAAGKDSELCEHRALGVVEQVVAPSDRRRQRPLAGRRVAWAGAEQLRLPLYPLVHLGGRQQPRSRRRQLDRQRQSVEAPADAGHGPGPVLRELERRVDRSRAGCEQADSVALDEFLERQPIVGSK